MSPALAAAGPRATAANGLRLGRRTIARGPGRGHRDSGWRPLATVWHRAQAVTQQLSDSDNDELDLEPPRNFASPAARLVDFNVKFTGTGISDLSVQESV